MADDITKDLALETLLDVAKSIAPDIPETLIKEIYAIQYMHQFDKERDISFQKLQRVLDKFIEETTNENFAK